MRVLRGIAGSTGAFGPEEGSNDHEILTEKVLGATLLEAFKITEPGDEEPSRRSRLKGRCRGLVLPANRVLKGSSFTWDCRILAELRCED